jgi:hypothetical protein
MIICSDLSYNVGSSNNSLRYTQGILNRYNDGPRALGPAFDSRQRKIHLFSTVSRPIMRSTQPPLQQWNWAQFRG